MSDDEKVYEASTGEAEPEVQGDEPWDWVRQLDETLVWLQGRWLPLSAVVLVASFLLFHAYAARMGVLIGLAAVDVLTMMPLFFVLASFLVGAFAVAACLPSLFLTTPLEEKGDSILGGIYRYPEGSEVRAKAVHKALYGWMLAWVVVLLSFLVTFVFVMLWDGFAQNKAIVIVTMGAISSFFTSIIYVRKVRVDGKRSFGIDFLLNLFGVGLAQNLIIILFLKIGSDFLEGGQNSWVAVIGVFAGSVISLVILYVIQVLVAALFLKGRKKYNLFKGVVSIGLVVLLLVSMWPSLGGWLMTKTFAGDISGARECARLVWRSASAGMHDAGLLDGSRAYTSVPVSVLIDMGGTLQVRPLGESKQVVYFVSVSELAAVKPCQRSADKP